VFIADGFKLSKECCFGDWLDLHKGILYSQEYENKAADSQHRRFRDGFGEVLTGPGVSVECHGFASSEARKVARS
jgi:hypothetical protein